MQNIPITPIENIEFPEIDKINIFNKIPGRSDNSMSGSQFGQLILNMPANQKRDDIIFNECTIGNIPTWMRNFKPITINQNDHVLTYFVSPDVLCIGNDQDFLRVSLNAYTARRVADLLDCILPTKSISDQIWQHADLKMVPTGMGASPFMMSAQTLIDHNNIIEKQRNSKNFNIIAGHKKDIIFHHKLLQYTKNICIYGWHQLNGKPVQDAQYIAHDALYQDYSHGIRLISRKAILNDTTVDLSNIVNNKQYINLIDNNVYDFNSIYIK